ncbi:spore coat protein YsxE [Shouchella clausii]|uniref:spore coat protein YsxE n=1 Tax=Shouchella tritolerans TaxID=2979466 RepID=UPI000787F69B|nr:spore coat protein YsxE [Shouchella tritolerans]GIN11598.1 spore coat protein YsxE [Shouchella clausii]
MNPLYEAILFYYDLQPRAIEQVGQKLIRVETDQGMFALKETDIDRMRADEFVHAIRKLTKLRFKQFIPVLPTKFGEYTLFAGDKSYYLMPWVNEVEYHSRISIEEAIADHLGVIHRLTVKTQPAVKELLDGSCERLLARWDRHFLEMSRFADQAEQNRYISPFELTFLTHYGLLEQLAEGARNQLEKWYEATLEKSSYRSVLTHGRLSRHHAMATETNELLLFNFEQASLDTPARDLASFCRRSFPYALWEDDEVFRWLQRYEQHLPLLDSEKHLLCAYLLYPDPIYYAVGDYRHGGNELEHVRRLEKRIIAMRKVQRFVSKLAPAEEKKEA